MNPESVYQKETEQFYKSELKAAFKDEAYQPSEVVSSDLTLAFLDLYNGLKAWRLWLYMSVADIRRRYRRTFIGPFWTTLSLAIFIFSMSVLFSQLWKTDIPSFLPFFSSGFITWVFVSTIITESCTSFVSADSLLKQLPFPYSIFSFLVVMRNLLVLAHHAVVYILIALIFSIPVNMNTLLFIPGLLIVCITGIWISLYVGLVCARFRDLQQVVASLLQISMFVTPVFWPPSQLSGIRATVFVYFNPLYHYMEIVRKPLLGQSPELISWIIAIAITILGSIFTMRLFAEKRKLLVFWL